MTDDPDRTGGTDPEKGGAAGPSEEDPQGMSGQMDDSMTDLEPGDDADEAARGIPQQDE